jgi:DNA-binding MarR family transcriptional regulator
MFNERLNTLEVKTLENISYNPTSLSKISRQVNKSLSWTSLCIKHLEDAGYIEVEKRGVTHIASICRDSLGSSLRTLFHEGTDLDLEKVLGGQGLKILSYLLGIGCTPDQLARCTGLSRRTVDNNMKSLAGMGIVRKDRNSKKYTLNQRHIFLKRFLEQYAYHRNRIIVEEEMPEAVIVWQQNNRFLLSTKGDGQSNEFKRAAYTRLDEVGYEIIHINDYYLYDQLKVGDVEEEEALIQALLVDPKNPRVARFIKDSLRKKKIDRVVLVEWALSYGLDRDTTEEVIMDG